MRLGAAIKTFLLGWLPAAVWAGNIIHDDQFTPDHVLRVSIAQVPSACETREDVVVNGTSPGPSIRLSPGARSWIRVYNDMADRNLSMHWHGISQRLAPFADGTPGVSQWPIPPGHFFDYEVTTEIDDAGSYFYHSHVDMQALSCTGPLIVEDCGSAPYHYDDERILLFQDYFQKTDRQMSDGLIANPFAWPGETRGILLNGKGVSLNQTAVAGPSGEAQGLFGSRNFEGCYDQIDLSDDCTLPVIDVEPGKTYRFRFIAATGLSALSMGFEDHSELTIVQVDGSEYNVPVAVSHIQLGGGQRFDVLFQAKTEEELGDKQSYFLQFETRDRPEVYRGYAVLRYNVDVGIPPAPPSPIVPLPREFNNWMEYAFQPLFPENNHAPTAEEVTRRVTLKVQQKIDEKTGRLVWQISHLSWTEAVPQKPVLIDIYERGDAAVPDYIGGVLNYGWDPHTKLWPALVDEILEIVIQNTGSEFAGDRGIVETHPFHAHGQHYYDIGSGPGLYDADANNAKLAELNYKAVKRDTTFVFRYGAGKVPPGEPAGWRAWRMRMANPGVWSIHCHILAHMMTGMQSVWVVGHADQIVTIPTHMGVGYFVYGGDAYGNATHSPNVYHFFDDTDNSNLCAPVVLDGGDEPAP